MKPSISKSNRQLVDKVLQAAARQKNLDLKEKFITAVEANHCIWNKFSPDYRNRAIMDDVWEEIGNSIGLSASACKKKWKNLRDHFSNLYNDVMQNSSGKELKDDDIKHIKWILFPRLMFIKDTVKPRGANNCFQQLAAADTSPSVGTQSDKETEATNEIISLLSDNSSKSHEGNTTDDVDPEQMDTLQASSSLRLMLTGGKVNDKTNKKEDQGTQSAARLWYEERARKRAKLQVESNLQRQILSELRTIKRSLATQEETPEVDKFSGFVSYLLSQVDNVQRRKQVEKDIIVLLYDAIRVDGQ